jgi:ATP-binding cassette subfamily F protein 3
MALATLDNLHKSYGDRVLFDGLNFAIERGERVGLIGDNGAGKTTLFKSLTGEIAPESGSVAIAKGAKVGHLAQDSVFDPANDVMDEAELAFAELHHLSHEMRALEHAMGEHEGEALEKTLKRYEILQHDFETGGGYAWRHRLEATLLGVGLGREHWEQNVQTLSGGQRSRLALAKLLINAPDLLLLDEPTNHLDLAAIDWLENWLLEFSGAVLLISHDRYLLDRLATRIVWLTRRQLSSYPGNYSSFVEQRQVQELTQQRHYEEQKADIEKQKEFIRRFGAGQRSKEAKGREKRLNRLLTSDAIIQQVEVSQKINLQLNTDQRAGDRLLTVRDLSKSYGSKVLWKDVKLDVGRGERIGIIGPNGSGKTTLLRILQGQEQPDAGSARWGSNLTIGYYDQQLGEFDPENSVLEELTIGRENRKEKELRDTLGALRFSGDSVEKLMGVLSGGERARVALAGLLLDKPNVLILDEPTNHLDVNSCEALEGALGGFEGTILCVSHDRYFLDRVAKRLLVIEPPQVIDFDGGFTAWIARKSVLAKEQADRAAQQKNNGQKNSPRKNGNQKHGASKSPPKRETNQNDPYARPFGRLSLPDLERTIQETEIAVAECQERMSNTKAARDAGRARRMKQEYDEIAGKLEALEAEYFARGES